MRAEDVGSLTADIGNLLVEGLRILDREKLHWGKDEEDLRQAMERALNDAKTDFQELPPLLGGHYELDRTFASLEELRQLRAEFDMHVENIRRWSRDGGHVDAVWVGHTKKLRRLLHRAQCHAAQRIFSSAKEAARQRCLGAVVVRRQQRKWDVVRRPRANDQDCLQRQAEEVDECHLVGGFHRFGDLDGAFICDFCDGHLLWRDIERIPETRTRVDTLRQREAAGRTSPAGSLLPTSTPLKDKHGAALSDWQATAVAKSDRQPKQVVYPPIAIASHAPPAPGHWMAHLLCPLCEDEEGEPELFDDLAELQGHLEWQHAPSSCVLM